MSETNQSFQSLMERVQKGCPDAVCLLVEQYGHHIVRAVRRSLAREMRSKFDSTDFAQAVWASFFRVPDRADELRTPEALLAFLTTLARNKVVQEFRRRLQSQKYNLRAERSAEDSAVAVTLTDRQPSPSQMAQARERQQLMLQKLPDRHQPILGLRLAGKTCEEIAAELGVSERTVRRALQSLARYPEA